MGSHSFVILSEAKNLICKARKAEILRFAQNDKYLNGDGTPQYLKEPEISQRATFQKD